MKTINKTRSFLLASLTAGTLFVAQTAAAATILVPAFVKDPVLLKQTMAACAQNPGELRNTPNCINASNAKAQIMLSFSHGKELSKCFKDKKSSNAPDAQCVDNYYEKKAK